MAEQIPLPARPIAGLPSLEISDGALLKFSRTLNDQLHDFERRFVTPRVHPRLFLGQPRTAPRKPR